MDDNMEDELEPHLRRGLLLIVALIITLAFAQPVTAKIGAYNIQKGNGWVSSTARCSCGVSSYNYGTGTFKDYCPNCKHPNALYFEEGAYYGYNKGSSPEGLWACKYCDMDFCCKCGKSHDHRNKWLIRTTKVTHHEPKPETHHEPVIQPTPEPEHYHTTDAFGRPVAIKIEVLKAVAKHL